MANYKLAVIASHPVPYQSAIFRALQASGKIDLKVYFNSDFGVNRVSFDSEFGAKIDWGSDALEGFQYVFLRNYSMRPRPLFWGQINPGIIKELAFGHYDAIWINGWNSVTNWFAFFAAILSGTKIMLRAESPWNQERTKHGFVQKIKRIILMILFRKIGAFLYIGEENRKFYAEYKVPSHKLFFTPYAVDNQRFAAAASERMMNKDKLRKNFGFSADDTVFLFVGKLIDKKRPQDLMEAYINSNISTKKLIFVGDGILRRELQERAVVEGISGVVFAGFQNPAALFDYYAIADVLVLPSGQGETWGLVVNEAMCFGLAVIVSELAGCSSDLVSQGENGFVVPPGDIKAITSAMEKLTLNDNKLHKAKQKSLEIMAGYTVAQDVRGILSAMDYFRK